MPILRNVEVFFPRLAADRPSQYQGKGPRKWSMQLRTRSKEEATRWSKEFGFKVAMDQDDKGAVYWKANINRRAFKAVEGSDGMIDNVEKPNAPVELVDGRLNPLDAYTVGNGSIANVAFSHQFREGKHYRTLTKVQLTTHVVRENSFVEDEFSEEDYTTVAAEEESTDNVESKLF